MRLLVFVFSVVVLVPGLTRAEQPFNPRDVQSSTCSGDGFNCGFVPAGAEEQRAIPEAPYVAMRGLPSSVDLSPRMPPPGNQGQQNSCVAWASAYAVKSYQEQIERNWGYDSPVGGGKGEKVFSPAFIYNQINRGQDKGSYIKDAMNLFVQQGAAPWSAMPYTSKDYRAQPSAEARNIASRYRAKGYFQVRYDDLTRIKTELYKGNPLVFGMPIDDAFYKLRGSDVYDKQGGSVHGGHAMAIVGYDDSKTSPSGDVGAFKIINSWGTGWGDKGYGWISYRMFMSLAPQILGMNDMQESQPNNPQQPVQPSPAVVEQEAGVRAPTQVKATAGTYADKVVVSWSTVKSAAAYKVYRANASDPGNFEELADAETNQYSDTDVQVDIAYRYKIVSVGEEDESELNDSPVAEGFARKQQQQAAPAQVIGLSGDVDSSGSRVVLKWEATAGARSYQVASYREADKKWVIIGSPSTNAYTDNSPKTQNRYAVRGVGQSAGKWSNTIAVQIGGGENEVPAAPAGLQASMGTYRDKIIVQWNSTPGARKYEVYRYDPKSQDWEGPVEVTAARLEDNHESVKSGKIYAYVVTAINAAGTSDYSAPVMGRANPNLQRAGAALAPPSNVRSSINEAAGTVTIAWDAVPKSDEYYVFRKKRGDKKFEFVGSVTTLTYSEKIPGKPGEMYLYTVHSKPALGEESVDSSIVSGFINVKRQSAKHRLLPGMGIEKFSGKWKGQYWDGRSAPQSVAMDISADGADYTVQFTLGSQVKSIKGQFPAGASSLSAAGFQMQLIGKEGDLARIDVGPSVLPDEITLTVQRSK